eukprot:CAMPEP_0113526782 /NCGR_PEP_ID=MMETSP0015_2-20120614/934_1 /TAXON_ID=2838 /ORGANISM="Odontella" /LENGTH=48 /DNA_ID=CAMNT_0000425149 /DNA_START=398 /DNA_END=541 /DNA_ORIENTATION=- /assembly_acc=CAM_ASM_000160
MAILMGSALGPPASMRRLSSADEDVGGDPPPGPDPEPRPPPDADPAPE